MTTNAEAWQEGFDRGLLYAKQAWWRIPKPQNPYPDNPARFPEEDWIAAQD